MEKKGQGFLDGNKKRWFQLRHYVLYYYVDEQPGWNTTGYDAPEDDDPSLLDKLPGLPDIKFPGLPNLSMPDMPSMDMPSMDMPSVDMPSMSMPSMGSMPKMPKKKERYESGPYGRIQMHGAKVKRSGKTVVLSNANQIRIFKGETEDKKGVTFKLTAPSEEEAISWYESMAYGGAEKED